MEDGFRKLIVSLLLFCAFTWLLLNVAIDLGAEYGRSSEDIGDGSLDLSAYENSISGIEGNVSAYRTSFEDGDVDDVDDASGIFGTAKKFINLITTPFTLLGSIAENTLKIPKLIVDIILGILGIALILGIWRVLRTGS